MQQKLFNPINNPINPINPINCLMPNNVSFYCLIKH